MCSGCGGTCGTARNRLKRIMALKGGGIHKKKRKIKVLVHKKEVVIPPKKVAEIRRRGYGKYLPKRIL